MIERLVGSFRHKTYRRYWTASMVGMVAFRIQDVALSWQVLEETDSSFMLGLVAFSYGVPLLVLGPITGALADHFNRELVIASALIAAALASIGLGVLILLDRILAWQIVVASCLLGTAFAVYAPARQALLPETVPCTVLTAASTVEYSSTRLMGFIGPVLAGVLIGTQGVIGALLLQASLFLLATVAFGNSDARETGAEPTDPTGAVAGGFFDGIDYLRGNGSLSAVILIGFVVVPFGMVYGKLLPVFVRNVLGEDASALGVMLGARSLGAALAGFMIAAAGDGLARGRLLVLSGGAFGCGLVVLSFSTRLPGAVILLFVVGLLSGSYLTLSNVLLQSLPPHAVRGRVMSIWGMVWGALPFVSLAAGAAADSLGVKAIIMSSGVICAAFSLGMALFDSRLNDLV